MQCTYDFDRLAKLLGSLYVITGHKITLKGSDFNDVLTSNPASEFCQLIQRSAYGREQCNACNNRALDKAHQSGSAQLYRCHAGLMASAIPIMEKGRLLAYLMYGQVLDQSPRAEQWAYIERQCGWHTDLPALRCAFDRLDQLSPETLLAYADVLTACASYIWMREYVRQGGQSDAQLLADYLEENYARPLTLATISSELGIGKTRLCQTARRELSGSVHELLLRRRIEAARQLLATTSLAVGQVAEAVGIDDANYFSKLFKAATGQTPLRYRNGLVESPA